MENQIKPIGLMEGNGFNGVMYSANLNGTQGLGMLINHNSEVYNILLLYQKEEPAQTNQGQEMASLEDILGLIQNLGGNYSSQGGGYNAQSTGAQAFNNSLRGTNLSSPVTNSNYAVNIEDIINRSKGSYSIQDSLKPAKKPFRNENYAARNIEGLLQPASKKSETKGNYQKISGKNEQYAKLTENSRKSKALPGKYEQPRTQDKSRYAKRPQQNLEPLKNYQEQKKLPLEYAKKTSRPGIAAPKNYQASKNTQYGKLPLDYRQRPSLAPQKNYEEPKKLQNNKAENYSSRLAPPKSYQTRDTYKNNEQQKPKRAKILPPNQKALEPAQKPGQTIPASYNAKTLPGRNYGQNSIPRLPHKKDSFNEFFTGMPQYGSKTPQYAPLGAGNSLKPNPGYGAKMPVPYKG